MQPLTDIDLLRELEPVVAANFARHLTMAHDWLPHECVPWSLGRDFSGDDGVPWAPEQSRMPDAVRAAFEVNLLTEDNLPSYHHQLAVCLGLDGPWGTWVRRWTAEEARHATSIRDYLILSRAVDPVALERDRMATIQIGWAAGEKGVLRSLAYVTLQELATRIAHRNTGQAAAEPVADRLLARIAADENLHMVFYRDLISAALELAPEQTMIAISEEVRRFKMPGTGVPGFLRKSVQIAEAGIYDVRLHRDEVITPLVRHWLLLDRRVADELAQRAQDEVARHLDRLEAIAQSFEKRRAHRLAGGGCASRSTADPADPVHGQDEFPLK